MNNFGKLSAGVLLLLAVAGSGYWLGSQSTSGDMKTTSPDKAERKVLYYRNPMGLPDTSPVPKKDSMGMDYIPVFEGGEEAGSDMQVSISVEKVQKLGVKSEAAMLRTLDKSIRAVGRIEVNERRTYTIAPKFEGWVEHLFVSTTGQSVSKGQALFDVYSPELISALREYALATQGETALKDAGDDASDSMRQLASASLARLKNWDIADDQIRQLTNGEAKRHLTFFAPVTGIVLEKKAVQGMRFTPGEMLYQIADLSSVWVMADVAEQDIGAVKSGSVAMVRIAAYPERNFKGKVDFIYPTLNTTTRTVQVRVELANPNGLLKPAMFADVELAVSLGGKVLAVPDSAVIDSGTRQIVLVQLAQGRFEPRTVRLGKRSDNYAEVLDGVAEGEQVVTSANFLIDAESNIKAALSGLVNAHVSPASDAAEDVEHGAHDKKGEVAQEKPAGVRHTAQGTLDEIYDGGNINISHDPIASLGWPGMNMDFMLANSSLIQGIQPGAAITFEFVEGKPGEYVITKIQAKPTAENQHEGH